MALAGWLEYWRSMGGGAQRSLLVFIALPLLLLSALGIRIGFDQANSHQQALLKSDLELIARAIRIPVGEALSKGDDNAVSVALQSIFTIERVYGASVFDRAGNRIASGGIAEKDLTSSSIPGVIEDTGEQQEAYREVDGHLVFSYFLPVFDSSGQSEGFIQITRRPDDFSQPLWHLTWISWSLWGLLAILIIGTVIAGYRRSLGRHVDQLVKVMFDVGQGARTRRAVVAGPREVAQIADGLNKMLDRIATYEREIEARTESERDLTARLKDNEKMAEIGDMARGFAHELGAPLSVIGGRAQRLERRAMVDSRGLYDLREIRNQVEYLTEIVNQLLEYSRHGARKMRDFDLETVIQRVAQIHENRSAVDLSIHLPASNIYVHGDPDRLQIALSCIIRNALQAAHETVEVIGSCENNRFHIAVKDDGPGLQGHDIDHLKKPFVTTRKAGEGTGLGLFIAERIASEHGSSLELDNLDPKGCLVTLSVPMARGENHNGE